MSQVHWKTRKKSSGRKSRIPRLIKESTLSLSNRNRDSDSENQDLSSSVRVVISGQKSGVLKFCGPLLTKEGIWCGIQLDEPVGKHDGVLDGIRYFRCSESSGLFAPLHSVSFIDDPPPLKRQNTFTIEDDKDNPEDAKTSRTEIMNFQRKGRSSFSAIRRPPTLAPDQSQTFHVKNPATPKVPVKKQAVEKETVLVTNSERTFCKSNYDADAEDEDECEQTYLLSEKDESLGILSPSEMQSGLPSLSTSCISDFGFDAIRRNDESKTDETEPTLNDQDEVRPRLVEKQFSSTERTFTDEKQNISDDYDATLTDEEKCLNITKNRSFSTPNQTAAKKTPKIGHFKTTSISPIKNLGSKLKIEHSDDSASENMDTFNLEPKHEETFNLSSKEVPLVASKKDKLKNANQGSSKSSRLSIGRNLDQITDELLESSKSTKKQKSETKGNFLDQTLIISKLEKLKTTDNTFVLPEDKENSHDGTFVLNSDEDFTTKDDENIIEYEEDESTSHDVSSIKEIVVSEAAQLVAPVKQEFATHSVKIQSKEHDQNVISTSSISSSIHDAGLGASMPSSMVSMGTSASEMMHSDLESSGVFSEAGDQHQNANKGYSKPKISPIEEKVETDESKVFGNETECSECDPDSIQELNNKRKRSEHDSMERVVNPNSKRSRSRSKEKKGLATRRSELLLKQPIVPNTKNVPSKLKSMLNDQQQKTRRETRLPKKPGRWDEIMNQIEQSRRTSQLKPKLNPSEKEKISESKSPRSSGLSRTSSKCSITSVASTVSNPPSGSSSLPRRSNSALSNISNKDLKSPRNRGEPSKKNSSHVAPDTKTRSAKASTTTQGGQNQQQQPQKDPLPKKKPSVQTNRTTSRTTSTKASAKSKVEPKSASSRVGSQQSTTSRKSTIGKHPDLVKEVVDKERQRAVENWSRQAKHNAKACDVLAIVIGHQAKNLTELKAEKERLENLVQEKEMQLANQTSAFNAGRDSLQEQVEKYKDEVDLVIRDCNEKISSLEAEYKANLDQVQARHKLEIDELTAARINDLTQQDDRHHLEVSELREKCQKEIDAMAQKWEQKLQSTIEEKKEELIDLESSWCGKEEKWLQTKKSLEDRIRNLEKELNEQGAKIRKKNSGDLLLKSMQTKLEEARTEVDSLNSVLELKSEEIRSLRQENQKLERKLEEFDRISLELKKATTTLEDLNAQLEAKASLERKLSAENRKLCVSMEKELNEKKRLSLEKEELMWKIRQSQENLSVSMMNGSLNSSFVQPNSSNLSCSFTEGSCKSLPPFTGRMQRQSRSFFDCGGRCIDFLDSSFVDPKQPQSNLYAANGNPLSEESNSESGQQLHQQPRFVNIVKKTESVAWKIQYEDDISELNSFCQSPILRRRVVPSSPSSARRNQSKNLSQSVDKLDQKSTTSSPSMSSSSVCLTTNTSSKVVMPVFETVAEENTTAGSKNEVSETVEEVNSESVEIEDIESEPDDEIVDLSELFEPATPVPETEDDNKEE